MIKERLALFNKTATKQQLRMNVAACITKDMSTVLFSQTKNKALFGFHLRFNITETVPSKFMVNETANCFLNNKPMI